MSSANRRSVGSKKMENGNPFVKHARLDEVFRNWLMPIHWIDLSKFGWLYFIVLIFSGCTTTATFYPVEGPLSAAKPVQPLKGVAEGVNSNNGKMKLTWTDGSICEGQWSSAAGSSMAVSSGSLFGTYGTMYGNAITVGTTGGENRGRAFLLCPDGNTVDMEFVTGAGTANGFGFAKDKNGNVFRVLF